MNSSNEKQYYLNHNHLYGPFDIIGDVHGCYDELYELMLVLGYTIHFEENKYHITHPQGRILIFVGDLVDRGPKIPSVLRLIMDAVDGGIALSVMGNHDLKFLRKLQGRKVVISQGLQDTLDQLKFEDSSFSERIIHFIESLPSHYTFDDGKLVVAHAGLLEEHHGKDNGYMRAFATYGATTGELDSNGLPIRFPWYNDYKGKPMVVYGHTVVRESVWINNTIDIDTGCVFGGKLTALRYPEKELHSIQSKATYAIATRPF